MQGCIIPNFQLWTMNPLYHLSYQPLPGLRISSFCPMVVWVIFSKLKPVLEELPGHDGPCGGYLLPYVFASTRQKHQISLCPELELKYGPPRICIPPTVPFEPLCLSGFCQCCIFIFFAKQFVEAIFFQRLVYGLIFTLNL